MAAMAGPSSAEGPVPVNGAGPRGVSRTPSASPTVTSLSVSDPSAVCPACVSLGDTGKLFNVCGFIKHQMHKLGDPDPAIVAAHRAATPPLGLVACAKGCGR